MKIGKDIEIHKSPQREVQKAGKKTERPIPVYIPEREKVPEKAEWKVNWRFYAGIDRAVGRDRAIYINGVF